MIATGLPLRVSSGYAKPQSDVHLSIVLRGRCSLLLRIEIRLSISAWSDWLRFSPKASMSNVETLSLAAIAMNAADGNGNPFVW